MSPSRRCRCFQNLRAPVGVVLVGLMLALAIVPAANANQPNLWTMSVPGNNAVSFETQAIREQVDEFNGTLSVQVPLFSAIGANGLTAEGLLSYNHQVWSDANPDGLITAAGAGLGWRFHFGRFIWWEKIGHGSTNLSTLRAQIEYPGGGRSVPGCEITGTQYTCTLQDFNRLTFSRAHANAEPANIRLTNRDGVRFHYSHYVRDDGPWAGGAEGYYVTQVEDRFGNKIWIDYYGQGGGWENSPLIRRVRVSERHYAADVFTSTIDVFLSGNSSSNHDRAVGSAENLTRLDYPGALGTVSTTLSYDGRYLQEVAFPLSQPAELSYYPDQDPDGPEHVLATLRYPFGGLATYSYGNFSMRRMQGTVRQTEPLLAIAKRELDTRHNANGNVTGMFWTFNYQPDGDLQTTIIQKHKANQIQSKSTTWFEPVHDQPIHMAKTGRPREQHLGALQVQRFYWASFEIGESLWLSGTPTFVALAGGVETERGDQRYFLSYRNHDRRWNTDMTDPNHIDSDDYDRWGNVPFVKLHGVIDTVTFNEGTNTTQDWVDLDEGDTSDDRYWFYTYLHEHDPAYVTDYLVNRTRKTVLQNVHGTTQSESWYYYDNDPVQAYPFANPTGGGSQTRYGKLSLVHERNLQNASKDRKTFYRWFDSNQGNERTGQPAEVAIRQDGNVYERTLFSYSDLDNPVFQVFAVKPTVVKLYRPSDGTQVVLQRTQYGADHLTLDWQEDENGQRVEYDVDIAGRVLAERYPGDGASTPSVSYTYDEAGLPEDPARMVIQRRRDASATYRPLEVFFDGIGRGERTEQLADLDGDGTEDETVVSSTFFYDHTSLPSRRFQSYDKAQGSGPYTKYSYDHAGRPTTVSFSPWPNGRNIAFSYGETDPALAGNQLTVTDENDQVTLRTYNAFGQLIRIDAPEGATTHFTYNTRGDLSSSTDPEGRLTTYGRDSLGQATSRTAPDSGTTLYVNNAVGQRLSTTAASGRQTDYSYDYRSRLLEVSVDGALDSRHHYDDYSALGRPLGVTPGFAAGRRTQTEHQEGYIQLAHDARGRIVEQQVALDSLSAKQLTYAWDAQDQLLELSYQGGTLDGLHQWFEYDGRQLLASVESHTSANRAAATLNATYAYRADGRQRRLELHDGSSGPLQGIDFTYNARGWLTQINHPSLTAADDPGGDANDLFGLRLGYQQALPGPWEELPPQACDDEKQALRAGKASLSGLCDPPSAVPEIDKLYNGNVAWLTWRTNGSTEAGYFNSYDDLGRLTRADFSEFTGGEWRLRSSFDVDADYDRSGNLTDLQRRDASGSGTSTNYSYAPGSSQLNSVSGGLSSSFAYDVDGNLIADSRRDIDHVTYNHRGLPLLIDANDDLELGYDHRGRRVRKSFQGNDRYYVRDIFGRAIAIYGCAGREQFNIFGTNQLGFLISPAVVGSCNETQEGKAKAAGSSNGGYTYFLRDHLGSVRVAVHQDGHLRQVSDYYPFGGKIPVRSYDIDFEGRYLFAGKERDEELADGWDYLGARYYDSTLGRFTTVDPLADYFPAQSPYSYAFNSPFSFIDPDGRAGVTVTAEYSMTEEVVRERFGAYHPRYGGRSGGLGGFTTAAADGTNVAPPKDSAGVGPGKPSKEPAKKAWLVRAGSSTSSAHGPCIGNPSCEGHEDQLYTHVETTVIEVIMRDELSGNFGLYQLTVVEVTPFLGETATHIEETYVTDLGTQNLTEAMDRAQRLTTPMSSKVLRPGGYFDRIIALFDRSGGVNRPVRQPTIPFRRALPHENPFGR